MGPEKDRLTAILHTIVGQQCPRNRRIMLMIGTLAKEFSKKITRQGYRKYRITIKCRSTQLLLQLIFGRHSPEHHPSDAMSLKLNVETTVAKRLEHERSLLSRVV